LSSGLSDPIPILENKSLFPFRHCEHLKGAWQSHQKRRDCFGSLAMTTSKWLFGSDQSRGFGGLRQGINSIFFAFPFPAGICPPTHKATAYVSVGECVEGTLRSSYERSGVCFGGFRPRSMWRGHACVP